VLLKRAVWGETRSVGDVILEDFFWEGETKKSRGSIVGGTREKCKIGHTGRKHKGLIWVGV